MGGSSKPAAAKPTPFVEPPAPRNPVPNWFQRSGAPAPRYAPPTAPVRGAFGAQGQPMPMQAQQGGVSGQVDPRQQPGEIDPQLIELVRRIMAGNGGAV